MQPSQEALLRAAQARGWIEGAAPAVHAEHLPRIPIGDRDAAGSLREMSLERLGAFRLRLPEARIVGRNFSLIVDDMMIPFGYAHSPAAHPPSLALGSPELAVTAPGRIAYACKPAESIGAADCELLGIVSHFGHFFVDALERLLDLDARGALDRPLLVDANLFGDPALRTLVVPQIAAFVRLLGIPLRDDPLVAIQPDRDYAVRDVSFATLSAHKPLVSPEAFRGIRRRLGLQDDTAAADGDMIFVGRSAVPTRRIADAAEVSRRLAQRGCETVLPEYLAIEEAARRFRAASRILLPIGSAKFNLVFCRPGTRVLGVIPRGYAMGGVAIMLRHLCAILGLRLALYECGTHAAGTGSPISADLVIGERDVARMLEEIERA